MLTKTDNYFKLDKKINKLIVGDSHTAYSIDDKILTNSINLSKSADNYLYSYAKIRTITQNNPQIDTILLGFAYHNLMNKDFENWFGGQEKYHAYFPLLTLNELKFLFSINPKHFINSNLYLSGGMLDIVEKIILGKNPINNLGRYRKTHENKLNIGIDRLKKNKTDNKISADFLEYDKEYLIKISNYCKQNNLTLILISTPIHSTLESTFTYEKDDYYEFYQSNLSQNKLLNFSKTYIENVGFRDCDHLNYTGAVVFSQILKNEIKNLHTENAKN